MIRIILQNKLIRKIIKFGIVGAASFIAGYITYAVLCEIHLMMYQDVKKYPVGSLERPGIGDVWFPHGAAADAVTPPWDTVAAMPAAHAFAALLDRGGQVSAAAVATCAQRRAPGAVSRR